jgi:hypothetical protein
MKGSSFLISITTILFIISTLFLAIDVADLITCVRTTLNADPTHTLGDKVTMAGLRTKRLQWAVPLSLSIGSAFRKESVLTDKIL